MKKVLLLLVLVISFACSKDKPIPFSDRALQDSFLALDEKPVLLRDILKKHKGKKIMLEVCASWCKECIMGLHHVNKLREEHPDVVFMFLSLDKNVDMWKKGIERFEIKGEHYFMLNDWNGSFSNFIKLKQIPQYMVINEEGEISLMNAKSPTSPILKEKLQN